MTPTIPPSVDRLIIHQFDPARASPGGIDTCLRGLSKYLPATNVVAFVGVDTGGGIEGRQLGQWEKHEGPSGQFYFLPVARLDPADQRRRIPHSLRLMLGVLRFRARLPRAKWVQTHRMDTGWVAPRIIGGKRAYFIHTQENGLTGQTSDSFWRRTGGVHQKLERSVVARADQVVVFNEDYAGVVARWNEDAQYSPTWFDPDLIDTTATDSEHAPHRIIWVGRLEVPKDPRLALDAFVALVSREPDAAWSLEMLGSGTLLPELSEYVDSLPADVRQRINLRGRVAPAEVAEAMRTAGVFLMTSHPGYEGYPRVLVESLASGLPAVVTDGSDTGHLIADGEAGYVTDRDPSTIADRLIAAAGLDRAVARAAAAHLSAPKVINDIYERTSSGAS